MARPYQLLKQRFLGADVFGVIVWTDDDGSMHSFALPTSADADADAAIAANADYQRLRAELEAGALVRLPDGVTADQLPAAITSLLGTEVWRA